MDANLRAFLSQTELFNRVPDSSFDMLSSDIQVQRFFPHVTLFEQGVASDYLYLIYSGSVEVRRKDTLTGMDFLLALYGPGKSIGEETVLTDSVAAVSAVAREETHVVAIHQDLVRRMMDVEPSVGTAAARIMARRTNRFVADKGVRFVSLHKVNVDPAVVSLLPERVITEHQAIPIARVGHTLTVAMVNPHNLVAYDDVQRACKDMYVEPVGVAESDFERFMRLHGSKAQQAVAGEGSVLPALPQRNHPLRFLQDGEDYVADPAQARKEVSGEQVIALMNQLIGDGLVLDASDIHIEPSGEHMHVRYRIDGALMRRAEPISMRYHAPMISRLKALASMDITERRKPQDGRLGMVFNKREVSLRMSTVPTRFGENMVMRVLDKSSSLMSLERIVTVPSVREKIRSLIFERHGIVLVTGPTGSGKTTTMYSAILERQDEGVNIVTIEDPIEYTISGITQVQYNEQVDLTYAEAVRAFLRQDTDIMLIGETRDARTAHNAIQAALSGHLVVTSLHTNSALGTIYRLQEMGIEPFLIANAMTGVVAQRLVRTICGECRTPSQVPAEVLRRLYDDPSDAPQTYQGKGCPRCNGTGFRGRTAVVEVLEVTEALRSAIAEEQSMANLRRIALEGGMVTFHDYAKYLLSRGITTPEEVLRVLSIEDDMRGLASRLVTCSGCGHRNRPEFSFCEECGTGLGARERVGG